jgi:branched-subunit amino acid ABC-type transport system permease component
LVRMRRGTPIERQQLKVFFYAAILYPAFFVLGTLTGWEAFDLLAVLGVVSVPIAVAIAILRYRLYDVDVLIRRTVTYAVLSVALLVSYVTGVALVQLVFSPVTAGNGLAVAISTLAVVALFQPLRRRIQSSVDRRFFRQRYDTARTLDTFAVRLRDEIDLDALQAELIRAVGDTVQPAHASLWLKTTR